MPLPADRVALATRPTPLELAARLAVALGLQPDDLWVDRDDLAGPAGGGNKIRELERTCAEALAAGADVLLTSGAPQSNHARLTAAAAARLGLGAALVLEGGAPDDERGNLLLDRLLGADVVWAGPVDAAGLAAAVEDEAERLRRQGRRPHIVPFGGSSPVAARRRRRPAGGAHRGPGPRPDLHRPGLAGLVAAVADGDVRPGQRVVVLHSGGLPGLFGHPDATRLAG